MIEHRVEDVKKFIEDSINGVTGHNSNTAKGWNTYLGRWLAFAKRYGLSEATISEEIVRDQEAGFADFVVYLGSSEDTARQYHKGLLRALDLYERDRNADRRESRQSEDSRDASDKSVILVVDEYPIPLSGTKNAKLSVPRNLTDNDKADLVWWLKRYAELLASKP